MTVGLSPINIEETKRQSVKQQIAFFVFIGNNTITPFLLFQP